MWCSAPPLASCRDGRRHSARTIRLRWCPRSRRAARRCCSSEPGDMRRSPNTAGNGIVARLLRPIADVQPGEATKTLLLALNLVLVLAAYYMLKTVPESLILAQGG